MKNHEFLNGRVDLYAYGRTCYAFVTDEHRFIIYNTSIPKTVFKRDFTKVFAKTKCSFKSLITIRDAFYAGLSDGRIFSFVPNSYGTEYICTDSKVEGLPGYRNFKCDPSCEAVKLLGGNREVLTYLTTKNHVVFLEKSKNPTRFIVEESIDAFQMHSERNELLLATKEKGHICMLTLRLPEIVQSMRLELPKGRDWKIMAISEQGEVACFGNGSFIIHKHGSSQNSPFTIGNSYESSCSGEVCFAGKNRFVYCGEKKGEIATAVRKRDGWDKDWTLNRDEVGLGGLELEYNGSLITHLGYDGTKLVVRVKGYPINGEACKEPDQGLLTFDEVKDNKVTVGGIVVRHRKKKSSRKKRGKSRLPGLEQGRREKGEEGFCIDEAT
jgi:hypothetical protein